MKIVVFARSTIVHSGSGGMEQVTADLVMSWRNSGHQVHIVTTSGGSAGCENTTVVQCRPGKYSLRWWIGSFLVSRTLKKTFDPDYIYSASIAGATAAIALRNVYAIAHSHGTFAMETASAINARSLREYVKVLLNIGRAARDIFFYRAFNRVVAVGPTVANGLTKFPTYLKSDAVSVLPNGIDRSLFTCNADTRRQSRHDWDIPDGVPLIGFIGRLHKQKGPRQFVDIAKHLEDQNTDYRLAIVGTGEESAALHKLISEYNLSGRVVHFGPLSGTALAAAYNAIDVVIMPGIRREGFPLVPIEARSCGCHVLVSPPVAASLPFDVGAVSVENSWPAWIASVSNATVDIDGRHALREGLYSAPNVAHEMLRVMMLSKEAEKSCILLETHPEVHDSLLD